MELTDKVALITGGGTGLGREIALQMAREGAHLALVYPGFADEPIDTVDELVALGVRAIAVEADVSNSTQVAAMIARVMATFGRIDVLVNSAGTTCFVPMDDLAGMTEEAFDRIMAVNVKGAFLCGKAVIPIIRAQGRGSIVSIGSVAAFRPAGSCLAYCVSKAALTHLGKCLARAGAPEVTVNTVAPGTMPTPWYEEHPLDVDAAIDEAPLKRFAEVEDVAAAVLTAVKNDSMTGQVLVVDAGLLLRV